MLFSLVTGLEVLSAGVCQESPSFICGASWDAIHFLLGAAFYLLLRREIWLLAGTLVALGGSTQHQMQAATWETSRHPLAHPQAHGP